MAVEIERAPVANYQFIERVSHYPIVQDTYQQLTSYYEWTKGQNSVVSRTLSLAENGVKLVATTAQPLVPRVPFVDDLACSQLNRLEHSFPDIHKPSAEIIQDTKELYEARVKPKVDTLVKPLTISYHCVSGGIYLAKSTANALVVYSGDQVAKLAEVPFVERVLDLALNKADSYVEYYLPAEAEEERCVSGPPNAQDGALCRLKCVSDKARRRAFARANRRLSAVKTVGQKAAACLLGLLEQSPAHLEAVVEKQQQPNSAIRHMLHKANHLATIVRHCVVEVGHQLHQLLSYENQIRVAKARMYSERLSAEIASATSLAELKETFVQQSRLMLTWILKVLGKTFGRSRSSSLSSSFGDEELECFASSAVGIGSNLTPKSISCESLGDHELYEEQG